MDKYGVEAMMGNCDAKTYGVKYTDKNLPIITTKAMIKVKSINILPDRYRLSQAIFHHLWSIFTLYLRHSFSP